MAALIKYIKKTKTAIEKLGDILLWPFVFLVILLAVFDKEFVNISFVWAIRVKIIVLIMGIIVIASGVISLVKLIQRKNEKNN